MKSPDSWIKQNPINVSFTKEGVGTTITFPTPILLRGGNTTYGFYITRIFNGTLLYTKGSSEGALYVQDANVQIKEGRGVDYPFGNTTVPMIWNGAIVYELAPATSPPVTSPPTTSLPMTSPPGTPVTSRPNQPTVRVLYSGIDVMGPVLAGGV